MNLQRVWLLLLTAVVIPLFRVVATDSGCINLSASGCRKTQEDQELASWTVKAKAKILKSLGLSEPPNISIFRRNVYRKESVRIRRQLNIQENETTIKLQTYPAWAGPPHGNSQKPKNRLFFAVQGCKNGYECIVHQATLKIYFRLKPQKRPSRWQISISIAEADSLLTTTTVKVVTNSGWIEFDIRPIVEKWIANPKSNQGVTVACSGCKKNMKIALWFWNWKSRKFAFPNPLLQLRISQRKLRRSTARFCNPNETHCCRRRFYLDFHKMDWDWIINPKRLHVHGCHGDCRPAQFKSTHSRLLHKLSNITSKGLLCCLPTQYSPHLFTYFSDTGKVITKVVDDISVDQCGCP